MKGDPKSWRTSAQTPESKKLEMMRRAKTTAETRHGLGGMQKSLGRSQKPVTLPKMPWNEDKEA